MLHMQGSSWGRDGSESKYSSDLRSGKFTGCNQRCTCNELANMDGFWDILGILRKSCCGRCPEDCMAASGESVKWKSKIFIS